MTPLQEFGIGKSEYERPSQNWICGWTADGKACHIGPTPDGRCRATRECEPLLKDGRWHCSRPPLAGGGGRCAHGPLPDGTCSRPIGRCEPVRTLRAKRGLLTGSLATFTFGILLVLFAGPWLTQLRSRVISAGDLSAPHSSINDCISCHTNSIVGEQTNSDMSEAAVAARAEPDENDQIVSVSADGLGRSRQCLTCHQLPDGATLQAHGLSPEELDTVTNRIQASSATGVRSLPLVLASLGPAVPQNDRGELKCATCHQEHGGRDANLAELGDLRCQACHVVKFSGFNKGHPQFTTPGMLVRYQFDHRAHEQKHFVEEEVAFQCTDCHTAQTTEGNMSLEPFARACATCHEDQIQDNGIAVFTLLGIDHDVLNAAGEGIGEWPFEAYDFENEVTPFMRLLLSADTSVSADLEDLANADLPFLEGEDPEHLASVARLVWAVKALYHDLIDGGRDAFAARLRTGTDSPLTGRELLGLLDQLPSDSILPGKPGWLSSLEEAAETWLPNLMEEVTRYRAGQRPQFRLHEDYESPLPGEVGGWYLEDLAVWYRPARHADEFARAWLDVTGRSYASSPLAREVFDALADDGAPGRCMKCHLAEVTPEEGRRIRWGNDLSPDQGLNRLATFTHAPHLATECQHCHVYETETAFASIEKSACVSCHVGNRVPDRCTTCHNFHVVPFELKSGG